MPTWPSTLPAPLLDGYALQPFDNCTRSPMESGHQRVRLEFTGDKDFLTVSWLMTGDQFNTFRDWHKADLRDGAAWFDVQLDYDGEGMKAVEARFAAKFAAKHEPPSRWRVSAKLELKYTPLTELEQDNVLAGIIEKDVTLLWAPETQAEVLTSKIGPDAICAYSGNQYDESGVSVGAFPALHLSKSKTVYYNFLAYSEDFSNAYWVKTNTTAGVDTLVESAIADFHYAYRHSVLSAFIGDATFGVEVKPKGRSHVYLYMDNGSGYAVCYEFNLLAKTTTEKYRAGEWTLPVAVIEELSDGYFRLNLSAFRSTSGVLSIRIAIGDGVTSTFSFGLPSYLGDGVSGVYLRKAQLTTSKTALPYVKTTSAVAVGAIPASGEPKGVWVGPVRANTFPVGGVFGAIEHLGMTLTGDESEARAEYTGGTYCFLRKTDLAVTEARFIHWEVKKGNTPYVVVRTKTSTGASLWITVNLDTLAITGTADTTTLAVAQLEDGWIAIDATRKASTAADYPLGELAPSRIVNPSNTTQSGLGVSLGDHIFVRKPMIAASAFVLPYVPPGVTSPTAAGGGTPSIPLVSGIAWDLATEPSGVELAVNGNFDSNVDYWVASGGVLSFESGRMKVNPNAGSFCYAIQDLHTIAGAKYRLRVELADIGTSNANYIQVGTQGSPSATINENIGTTPGVYERDFIAPANVTRIRLASGSGTGFYALWDNVSVQRLVSELFKCFEKPNTDGVEQIVNGNFADGLNGWTQTAPADWTVVNGAAKAGATGCFLYQTPASGLQGKTVRVRFRIVDKGTVGSLNLSLSNGGATRTWGYSSGIYNGMWVEVQGAKTLNGSVYFFPSSGWDGSITDISVQVVEPVAVTMAVEVTMGANATEIIGDSTNRPLLCPNHNTNQAMAYRGDSTAASAVRVSTYDNTTWGTHPTGTWERYERHLKVAQVNAARTQYRSGNKRIGVDSSIQWGSWTAFDGSYDAIATLIAAYGGAHPLWLRRVMVCKTGELTEKQIEDRLYA